MDKDFYNRSSATPLGWDPSWFGENYFHATLVRSITTWQNNNGLKPEDLYDPNTLKTSKVSKIIPKL